MPLIVDKEKIKTQIIESFERLSATRPLTTISLREIASEAGISHTKILHYFENKTGLYVASAHWASSIIQDSIRQWFETHKFEDYTGVQELIGAFFADLQHQRDLAVNPHSVIMASALGEYNEEIRSAIREEYAKLEDLFTECVEKTIGRRLTKHESYALLILYNGVYFTALNEDTSANASCHLILGLEQLLHNKENQHETSPVVTSSFSK